MLQERYKIDEETGCWNWQGAKQPNGYGMEWFRGKTILAHRAAYIRKHGKIPAGLQIDHKCKNRICINPDHLEAVEPKENLRRSSNHVANFMQNKCKRGHELTPENIIKSSDGTQRRCKICFSALTGSTKRTVC